MGLSQAEVAGERGAGRRMTEKSVSSTFPCQPWLLSHTPSSRWFPLTNGSSLGYGANSYILVRFPLPGTNRCQTTFTLVQEQKSPFTEASAPAEAHFVSFKMFYKHTFQMYLVRFQSELASPWSLCCA